MKALDKEPMAKRVSFLTGACDVTLVTPKGSVQLSIPLTTERLERIIMNQKFLFSVTKHFRKSRICFRYLF